MLFNSFSYALFLPVVFFLYWALPHRFRWVLLLASGYFYYMCWNAGFGLLLVFTTAVSYAAALGLERLTSACARKLLLGVSAAACLSVLFFYKYFNFFSETVVSVLRILSIPAQPVTLRLLLPVGISFYTFRVLSYLIDVYRGKLPAERHLGIYAAYVSFFPQILAGPIERADRLLPRLHTERIFDYSQTVYALRLMAWGYFKKLVLADTLARYVNCVFDSPRAYSGFSLVLAALFFTVQIYCDFSGYSDIAIGTAKLLGFDTAENFRSPYFSQSIKEFWGRWHISLSSWFRDYVYIPLGGNRVSRPRLVLNNMLTFLASGLWHGASWSFVLWGGLHGAAVSLESLLISREKLKSRGALRVIRTALVVLFCTFAWIFFASQTVEDAFYVIAHLFDSISDPVRYFRRGLSALGLHPMHLVLYGGLTLILGVFDGLSQKTDLLAKLSELKPWLRWSIYIAFLLMIALLAPVNNQAAFIYLQF